MGEIMKRYLILTINPGSTSTKIALFRNLKSVFLKSLYHSIDALGKYKRIGDQYEYRKDLVIKELEDTHLQIEDISAVVGRGGLIRPVKSGTYEINDAMLKDLKEGRLGEHASNLGGLIAYDIAATLPRARAFIADPVVVDEMDDVARIAGHPEFERISIFHALNHKATARSHAKTIDRYYEDLNLIVAHLGGGISVGAHRKGRVIDVNNALDGDGPFSPERSGSLPVGQLIKMCFSEQYSFDEMDNMIKGKGGLIAYLNTNDAYEVELMVRAGDEKAKFIQEALCYQVAKEIGSMSAVLEGQVDAIILTGGIAHNPLVVDYIRSKVHFIAPVAIYPGEDEMHALAENGLRVLKGETKPLQYE